jgi:hypothetical protein
MKVITFLILITLLNIFAIGQESNNRNLSFFIQTRKKQVCIGDYININARLTNKSEKNLVIDTKKIGLRTSLIWFKSLPNGNSGGSHDFIGSVSPNSPDYKILRPNQSYSVNLKFVFNKKDFTRTQKYKMQIAYEQDLETKFEDIDVWQGVIDSNKIDIFVNRCKKK